MHLEEKNGFMEEEKAKRANDKHALEASKVYKQEETEEREVKPINFDFFRI